MNLSLKKKKNIENYELVSRNSFKSKYSLPNLYPKEKQEKKNKRNNLTFRLVDVFITY